MAGAVRAAAQAVDPHLPGSSVRSLDQVIGASLAQRKFNMTLLMVFAGIALVLAVAGSYGTVAYAVAQRTQETAATFVALPALLGAVALIASFLPALRATPVDSIVALRAD